MPSLIARILPVTGLFCVATKAESPRTGFLHRFCQSHQEVEQVIKTLDASGKTVYLAQSSFHTPENRKADNTCRVKSFWFDIDCGPEKYAQTPDQAYPTQRDGADALRLFVQTVGLPMPSVVSSGNGLYAHWVLREEVLPDQWKGVASILKALCETIGFKADRSRTSDLASVLRPIGSTNRKNNVEKPVLLALEAPDIDFLQFAGIIHAAAKQHKVEAQVLAPPKVSNLNTEFADGLEGPPSNAEKIAEHCTQIRRFRDAAAGLSEPEWYAGIGVLRHCEEGEDFIHEWSSAHPDYTPAETAAKIAQHQMPPTTCHHYGQLNPAGCVGCRHSGKIKTPIVLGRTLQEIEASQIDPDRMDLPNGYLLTASGLVLEEDTVRFYPHDIYPCLVARDQMLGQETVKFKHYLPLEGWNEFTLASGVIRDPKTLLTKLQENHVGVTGNIEGKLMHDYLSRYVDKLRSGRRISNLFSQMGWKKDGEHLVFIVGDRLINKDGGVAQVGLSKNIPEAANHFNTKGELQTWIQYTKLLDSPNRRAHQFSFLSGFGAPLMMFTGFEGATVAVVGKSGIGKTLMSRMALSIYGDPNKLMMAKEDTKNSLVARLGVYGSLPFAIDEVSNIDPMDLSDLVYRITQGRDKVRLTKASVEKSVNNQWNTLAIVSSNHSLIDRLSAAKTDASAEMNRIFEFTMHEDKSFTKDMATGLYRTIRDNYGVAAEPYLRYLVQNQASHAANIDKLMAHIDSRVHAKSEERFLSAVVAVTIYGGMIAQKIGLIQFDVAPVMEWAIDTMLEMRGAKHELISSGLDLLGQFLDRHAGNMLVLASSKGGNLVPYREPRGTLVARLEMDTMKCYISRDELKKFVNKVYGSYTAMKKELETTPPKAALVRSDCRMSLAKGVPNYVSAPQYLWEIDLSAPVMGNVVAQLVEDTNAEFRPKVVRR